MINKTKKQTHDKKKDTAAKRNKNLLPSQSAKHLHMTRLGIGLAMTSSQLLPLMTFKRKEMDGTQFVRAVPSCSTGQASN